MKKFCFALSLLTLATFSFAAITPQSQVILKIIPASAAEPFRSTDYGNLSFPFDQSPCTEVKLTVTGDYQLDIRGVVNGNNGILINHWQAKLEGEDENGNHYQGTYNPVNFSAFKFNGSTFVSDSEMNVMLTTAGGSNNIRYTSRIHITVNANGETTVNRTDETLECQ